VREGAGEPDVSNQTAQVFEELATTWQGERGFAATGGNAKHRSNPAQK
jgi:hypothetical protein